MEYTSSNGYIPFAYAVIPNSASTKPQLSKKICIVTHSLISLQSSGTYMQQNIYLNCLCTAPAIAEDFAIIKTPVVFISSLCSTKGSFLRYPMTLLTIVPPAYRCLGAEMTKGTLLVTIISVSSNTTSIGSQSATNGTCLRARRCSSRALHMTRAIVSSLAQLKKLS